MNIDAELTNSISLLSTDEKKLVLELIKKLNSENKNSSLNKAILFYNMELEEAVQQIKQGNYTEHTDVLKETEEW